jgi:UDPglucose 6-dehydrogenase
MKIAIVGTGYVGLVTGTCLAGSGNQVTCLDIDQDKIDRLNAGEVPIYEPGLEDLIRLNTKGGRLQFTTSADVAYADAEAIFVCVGTPSNERGDADLSAVLRAAADIGDAIEAAPVTSGQPPIVIVKSTVPVGTNAKVKRAIAARTKRPFRMASNPEFLKEGAAILDFTHPERVVIGCEDEGTGERLRELYQPFVRQGNPILIMDVPSAELVKYASNTMLAMKISFINEIALMCEGFGADVEDVRRGMCSDTRIGNKFLYPGLGYGGSCFPKDVLACIGMARSSGSDAALFSAVHDVNQEQRIRFFDRVKRHFDGSLEGRRIALWGLAFKPETDDVREAPALTAARYFLARGAEVSAYDPVALDSARDELGDGVHCCEDPYESLSGADALLICTDWSQFKQPDFERIRQTMTDPVIFDGRNLYEPRKMEAEGIDYHSIGRRSGVGDHRRLVSECA